MHKELGSKPFNFGASRPSSLTGFNAQVLWMEKATPKRKVCRVVEDL
jgi:hypothetical protein